KNTAAQPSASARRQRSRVASQFAVTSPTRTDGTAAPTRAHPSNMPTSPRIGSVAVNASASSSFDSVPGWSRRWHRSPPACRRGGGRGCALRAAWPRAVPTCWSSRSLWPRHSVITTIAIRPGARMWRSPPQYSRRCARTTAPRQRRGRQQSTRMSGRKDMKRSTDRIITSHAGSLHRPDDLRDTMAARNDGDPFDAALAKRVDQAVHEVVRLQAQNGVDVVNDGEYSKRSWQTYSRGRLSGLEIRPLGPDDDRAYGSIIARE